MRLTLYAAVCLCAWGMLTAAGPAQEHRVEATKNAPPSEGLSKEIALQLAPGSIKVTRGDSRSVCEIWPAKKWSVKADFKSSLSVLYPFKPGELIGVVQYRNRGEDFRGQEIPAGVYTIRYAQQPEDGNHAGTSPTRDFFLLVSAEKDVKPGPIPDVDLFKLSAESISTTHPAMLCLLKVEGESASLPAVRHREEHDQWSVRFAGTAQEAGKQTPRELQVEVIVVGKSPE